jgi:cytoskeletal protein RodZ
MDESNTPKNLFEELKNLRIQKGISLDDVAESLRIQLRYLHSIEEGNILDIPEVYDKLFFRSYLKALKVDNEEECFEQFLQIRKHIRIDKTTSVINISKSSNEVEKNIFSHRNLFVALPIFLIIVVISFLLVNTQIIGNSTQGKVQEINIKNVVERIEAKEKARLDSIKTQQEVDSVLSLKINATKRTWFRVVLDKSDTTEYLLQPGQQIDTKAEKTFEFLIGRADGLSLILNGKSLGLIGIDSTVVRYMLIDSSGVVVKLFKEKSDSENKDQANASI